MKPLFLLSLFALITSAMAEERTVTGTVTYSERIAISNKASIRVALEDVSVADRAAPIIAETMIEGKGKQVPFAFSIKFDSAQIQSGITYGIRAQIWDNGQLRFTSTSFAPAKLDGTDAPFKIVVNQIIHPVGGPETLEDTRWLLYEMNGNKTLVSGNRELALTFNPDDRKFGAHAGVNQIGGAYMLDGIKLIFGDIVSTKMAGSPAQMKQESAFIDILSRVTKAKVFGHNLVLYQNDKTLAKFKSSNAGK